MVVECRYPGGDHRLPAARPGAHPFGREGRRRVVRPYRADGVARPSGRGGRRPLGADAPALMVGSDVVRAAAIGGLAVSLALSDTSYWVIVVIAFVEGAGTAAFLASHPGALRAVVPTEQLPEAVERRAGARPPYASSARRWAASSTRSGAPCRSWPTPVRMRARRSRCCSCGHSSRRTVRGSRRPSGPGSVRGSGVHVAAAVPAGDRVPYGLLNFTGAGLLFCIVVIGQGQGLRGGELGLLTALFAVSVLVGSLVSPAVRRVLSVRGRSARNLDLDLLCRLSRFGASCRRPRGEPDPGGSGHPVHRFGGERVPDCRDSGTGSCGCAESVRSAIAAPPAPWRRSSRGSCCSTRHRGGPSPSSPPGPSGSRCGDLERGPCTPPPLKSMVLL